MPTTTSSQRRRGHYHHLKPVTALAAASHIGVWSAIVCVCRGFAISLEYLSRSYLSFVLGTLSVYAILKVFAPQTKAKRAETAFYFTSCRDADADYDADCDADCDSKKRSKNAGN